MSDGPVTEDGNATNECEQCGRRGTRGFKVLPAAYWTRRAKQLKRGAA